MVDQNLEQPSSDSIHNVENALSSLWDKAREASLLISTLREEKKNLLLKMDELEEELRNSRNDVSRLQSQIDSVNSSAETARTSSVNLEEDEKKLLQQKLRSVISKLDQYLTQ